MLVVYGRYKYKKRLSRRDRNRNVSIRIPILSTGSQLTRHGENFFTTGGLLIVGIFSSPKSKGASLLRGATRVLHNHIHVKIVMKSLTASGSTRHLDQTSVPMIRVAANAVYRLSTHVVTRTVGGVPLSSLSILVVRGINGLIYPTSCSLKRNIHIILLSIARNRSGPLGCPPVFRSTSITLIAGSSLTSTISFGHSTTLTTLGGITRRTRIVRISSGANRKVRT